MKLMKILLVLVVLSMMVPMASAGHSFDGESGTGSSSVGPIFISDTAVTDTVGRDVGGYAMYFVWTDPDEVTGSDPSSVRQAGITFMTDDYTSFVDVLPSTKTDEAGVWEVEATEMGVAKAYTTTDNFVIQEAAAEFFLGPFMALLLVGILYAAMRRNLAGSFNVN